MPRAVQVALGAAVVTFIGSLLPWVSLNVFGISETGSQTGDGTLVLIMSIIAGALIVAGWRRSTLLFTGAAFGFLAFAVCAVDIVHVFVENRTTYSATIVRATPGPGLWLAFVSSGVLVGAVVRRRRDLRRAAFADAAD
jgi:hypothetical protein